MNMKAIKKVMISEMAKFATAPFRLLPVKKNRILFTGLTGGKNYDYSCNPKYLYEYLRTRYEDQYEYVWVVDDCSKYPFLKEEGVKLVSHFTVSSFPMLLTSKVIVTNGSYAPWFPFRKKQFVINTWHGGGAYKKIENERADADWATKWRAKFCAKNIDLFVASCKMQEENMIRKTFLYQGEVLRAGLPRNDNLVRGNIEKASEKVRMHFGITEEERIVLYAPTYRNLETPVNLDGDAVVRFLEQHFTSGEKWHFMCRYHRYQTSNSKVWVSGENVIDVANYPDMQELLCAADLLITDYSSCVWDYALLKRPCFLYIPDKEEYIEQTGFYVGLDEWPFMQAKDMENLCDCFKNYKQEEQQQRVREHFKALGSYETGTSCEKIAGIIGRICNL